MGGAAPQETIEAHVQGEISGQVAVGKYILQIGSIHGGVVNIAAPEQHPQPRPRPTPVFLRPRPFPDLLDREEEVRAATRSFQSTTPVAFHGEAGLGKTALLRYLAHHPATVHFPDGVVFLSARGRPLEDLLQSLFEAFYETDVPFKPTETQIRHALQGKQALILLDDVGMARDEVEALLDAAPRCTFALASLERCLWGEGRIVALRGLPPEASVALVERELGRPLSDEERPAAEALCTALKGHPLHILQAVALVREGEKTLSEVVRIAQVPSPTGALAAEVVNPLTESQRRILAALAALGDAPLPADHLAAISGVQDVQSLLQDLVRRGLVQAHSPRYSLTGRMGAYLQRVWDLTPWAERALAHFTSWAESQQPSPGSVAEVAEAILRTLEWATTKGRWPEVLRLGYTVERALALSSRWGAWERVLQWMLQGARAAGNRAGEAWALHQLGTRALCLGDQAVARGSLSQALRLRESLGDRAGATVTRHNLDLLAPPAAPSRRPSPARAARGLPPAAWVGIGLAAAAILLGLAGAIWHLLHPTPTPPPGPTPWEAPALIAPEPGAELPCGPEGEEQWVEWQWTPVQAAGVEGYDFYLEILEPEPYAYPPQFTPEPAWAMSIPCGRTYRWRVRAVGGGNTGDWSEEWVFSLVGGDTRGPPPPALLEPKEGASIRCLDGEGSDVPLRWEAVDDTSGIAAYEVRLEPVIYETPVGAPPPPRQISVGEPMAEVWLECGWNYRWQVRAVDGAGNPGEWSDWGEFRVLTLEEGDSAAPPPPTPIEPGSADPADPANLYPCSQVILYWEPVDEDPGGSGILGYRVSLQRYAYDTEQWESIEPYFIIYEPFVDVTEWLSVGTYRWNVWAIDNAGNHGEPSLWLYFECPIG